MNIERTFLWHDYETSGADPKRDRPYQFAAIRTDENLNIIGEPIEIYCKPSDDFLPHPEACLITGITPQKAIREGLCEAQFIAQINALMSVPGTCTVGYNNLRFDDEITRYALYRNFFDPYAREWQNQCSRWDLIDMLRLTRALRPEGIEWPNYEDGSASFRLEDLSKANGIEHGNAHDAMADVYATIEMARIVRSKQRKLYDFVLLNKSKQAAQKQLDVASMKPVLHISSRYPSSIGNAAIIAPLSLHPSNKNSVISWDLRDDPMPLIELDAEEIIRLMYLPRDQRSDSDPKISLKQVHINKCPILAPANMLNSEEAQRLQIEGSTCRTHLAMLRNYSGLSTKLAAIFSNEQFESDGDPDHMLYSGGFFGDTDKKAMEQIRDCPPDELGSLDLAFQDPRLEEMLFRYRARNYPDSLDGEELERWELYRHERLVKADNRKLLTMQPFYDILNKKYQDPELSNNHREILEELAIYAESIFPIDQ
ncbi:MAG: exodeoxyribonuclease I [Oceanospirillaceae bacterium]|nr:exodeoxyribonuclease I [Oceanospirillaceae bacterium]